MAHALSGVWVPALTPFTPDLRIDVERHVAFCRTLLAQGADGLALFGTTSEANSLTLSERMELLEALVAAGLPPNRMMPGTGACALGDAVQLTRHAVDLGCRAVLMLPPFYYKGVSDDGLHRFFAEVVERVGSDGLRIYLYHIPPVSQVPISLDLVARLIESYPGIVAGIKDSSGDWSNTRALLERFPDFDVFPGSEVFLLDGLRAGAAGCITASGNVNLRGIRAVLDGWRGPEADALQAEISHVRKIIQAHPMIPALKRILAHALGDPAWAGVRPPLQPLGEGAGRDLLRTLSDAGFSAADLEHARI